MGKNKYNQFVRPIDIFSTDRIVNVVPFPHTNIFYNFINS